MRRCLSSSTKFYRMGRFEGSFYEQVSESDSYGCEFENDCFCFRAGAGRLRQGVVELERS